MRSLQRTFAQSAASVGFGLKPDIFRTAVFSRQPSSRSENQINFFALCGVLCYLLSMNNMLQIPPKLQARWGDFEDLAEGLIAQMEGDEIVEFVDWWNLVVAMPPRIRHAIFSAYYANFLSRRDCAHWEN